jgi:integrase/recombinase XerC
MAKPLPKALSVDDAVQLAQFSDDTKDNEWYNARDAAMVELLYSSGLRVAELVGLDAPNSQHAQHANPRHAANAQVSADTGWLDLQAGEAHVVGKGSKRRTVPIGRQAIAAINTWLTMRENKLSPDQAPRVQALFIGHNGTRLSAQSVWQRLKKRSLQAGLSTPVHPHMLRHSFASHVLQSSSDLRAVQEMLGHANISTTQVYTRLDFQHLAKAYDAAHPRAFKKQSSPSKKTST